MAGSGCVGGATAGQPERGDEPDLAVRALHGREGALSLSPGRPSIATGLREVERRRPTSTPPARIHAPLPTRVISVMLAQPRRTAMAKEAAAFQKDFGYLWPFFEKLAAHRP